MKPIDPVLAFMYLLIAAMLIAGAELINWFASFLQTNFPIAPEVHDPMRVIAVILWTLTSTVCSLPAARNTRRQILGGTYE